MLHMLRDAARPAAPEEQAVLARWSGWGALPTIFNAQPVRAAFDSDDEYRRAGDRWTSLGAEREEIRALLSEAEWNAASRNTLNAHYTDVGLVGPIWQTVRRLGFDGGDVLEPGCGSGNFIALAPTDTSTPVRMTGVELDPTTAGIARLLHPGAKIHAQGFEALRLRAGRFNAAIGNVPFGDYPVYDEVHNPDLKLNIHNHFILKALHAVEPGGVVALITSRWTLDAHEQDVRRAIHEAGDLVGAVRLPARAHLAAAGTDVVTDVLFLRRRTADDTPGDTSWLRTEALELPGHHQPVEVNSYFLDHPEQVVGDLRSRMGRHGPELTVVAHPDARVADGLAAAAARVGAAPEPDSKLDDEDLPDGALGLDAAGNPTVVEDGVMVPVEIHPDYSAQLVELIRLKQLTNRLYAAEAASTAQDETPQLAAHRARLREALRTYRRRHPVLAKPGQYRVFTPREAKQRAKFEGIKTVPDEWKQRTAYAWIDDDPDAALLFGLEVWDDKAGKGIEQKVLHDRVLAPRVLPTHAATPEDAIAIALEHDGGRLDINRVASLLDVSAFEAADRVESAGLAYRDPDRPGEWEPRHLYLSGNVKTKLATAQAVADRDPAYRANVIALEAVLPPDLHPSEIKAKIGAPWIPAEVYTAFLHHLGFGDATVKYAGGTAWEVRGHSATYGDLAEAEWGTPDRNTKELFSTLLTQTESTITINRTANKKTYVDREATDAAREKAREIAIEFADWVWTDQGRAQQLARIYNDTFNNLVAVEHSSAPMTLPGLVTDWEMRPHQNAAIRRILASNTALLAHVVGAGKTATMVAAAMELRRTGLAKKPAVVVPNHMLKQWTRDFRRLYPNAKLLAITASDLSEKRRKKFMARIAGGEWDAVILTHKAFERVPLRPQTQSDYIDREMANLRSQVDRAQEAGMDKRRVKEIESALARAEAKIKQKIAKTSDRRGVYLEDTGLDYVFVDESHEFKNLRTVSAIPGAAIDGADKATKLHMLLDFLRRNNRTGRVATLATGTPIANSVTEAYVLMRYMVPEILDEMGLEAFDNWAGTFGEVVSSLEPDPKGEGYKMKARFARFFNVPELLAVYWGFADVQTAEDLKLPTPPVRAGEDGQRGEKFLVPASIEQRQFVKLLPSQPWIRKPGGVLKALGEGLRASLDMSLVGYSSEDGSKLPVAAEQIAEIWRQTRNIVYPISKDDPTPQELPGALQLVFLDDGTPNSKAEHRVNLYDELRERLVAIGMPGDTIRFMHDAGTDTKKDKLFADARSGRVTVLIGSTPTMGTGTNVQDRAIALHHLSYPWKPADMAQRDGRIERQGNLNHPDIAGTPDEVRVLYYITERTFDEFRLNTLARKARFINQMQKRGFNLREIEDIGEDAVNFGMLTALASGDPTLLHLAEATAERARLEGLARTWDRQQDTRAADIAELDEWHDHAGPAVEVMRTAATQRISTTGDRFAMTISGSIYRKRADAAQALAEHLLRIAAGPAPDHPVTVGELGGLPILTDFDAALRVGRIGFGWKDPRLMMDRRPLWGAQEFEQITAPKETDADAAKDADGHSDHPARQTILALERLLAKLDDDITAIDTALADNRVERDAIAGRLAPKTDNPYRPTARSKEREERLLGKLVVANEKHSNLLARAGAGDIPETVREELDQTSAEVDRLKIGIATEHRIQKGEEPEALPDQISPSRPDPIESAPPTTATPAEPTTADIELDPDTATPPQFDGEMYEHRILAPSQEAAVQVTERLKAHRYLVPYPPAHPTSLNEWVVVAYGSAAKHFAEGGDDDILAACDEYGATHDGGSFWAAPPTDAEVRQLITADAPQLTVPEETAATDTRSAVPTPSEAVATTVPPQPNPIETSSHVLADAAEMIPASRFTDVAEVLDHWRQAADGYRVAETRSESVARIRSALKRADDLDATTAELVADTFLIATTGKDAWTVLHIGTALRVAGPAADRDTAHRWARELAAFTKDGTPFDWASDGLRDRMHSPKGRKMCDTVTGRDTQARWQASLPDDAETHAHGDDIYHYSLVPADRITVWGPDGAMIATGTRHRHPTRHHSVWITEMRDGRAVPGPSFPRDLVDHVIRQHLLAQTDPADHDPVWIHYDDGRAHVHGTERGDEMKKLIRSCGFTWSGNAKAWVSPSSTLAVTTALSVTNFVDALAQQGRVVEIRADEQRLRSTTASPAPSHQPDPRQHTDIDRAEQQPDTYHAPPQRPSSAGRYSSVGTAITYLRSGSKPPRWSRPPRMHGTVTVAGATSDERAKARIDFGSDISHHYQFARGSQLSDGGRFLVTRARPNAVWEVFHIQSGTVMTLGAGHPNKDAALDFANSLETICDATGATFDWESPYLGDRLCLHTSRDELAAAVERGHLSTASNGVRSPEESSLRSPTTPVLGGFMGGRTYRTAPSSGYPDQRTRPLTGDRHR
ncbi:SNF2-related protein [Nocardia vaccinii]|uniref:SNF2-related protein n=1 Tax=Nocardia vaccinii TaxID=1822 RepID=UPI001FE01AD1|nr:SNF2-related protein [Nocardia vaccinii]